MDDTLDKENIFMIFDELQVKNSPLQILFRSVETAYSQNFIVHQQLTTSFPPVFKCHRLLHMRPMSKQAKSNTFLLSFSTLELSNTTNMNKHKIKKHTNPNIFKP